MKRIVGTIIAIFVALWFIGLIGMSIEWAIESW